MSNSQFKSFIDSLGARGFSEHSIKTYVNSLEVYWSQMHSWDLKSQMAYRAMMESVYKPNTINIRVSALNSWNDFKKNGIRLKQVTIVETSFCEPGSRIEESDYHKLLDGLKNDGQNYWVFIIRFLATTGLRIGEAAKVKFSDLQGRKSFDVIGKGGKSRPIFLSSSFVRDCSDVINSMEGPILTTSIAYFRFKLHEFQKKYSIKSNLHPHGFRSLFCRLYYKYDRRHDLRTLQSLMGHADLKTTGRYLKKTSVGMTRKISSVVKW